VDYGKIVMALALTAMLMARQPPNEVNQASTEAILPHEPSSSVIAMDSQTTQATTANQATTPAGQALARGLTAGMAYGDFRKLVLSSGWTPVVDPQCKANVVGENHEALCKEHSDLTGCQVCDQLPELSAYSGDGYCLVRFHHTGDGEILKATCNGMISDWNVPGDNSRLQVSKWNFSKASAH